MTTTIQRVLFIVIEYVCIIFLSLKYLNAGAFRSQPRAVIARVLNKNAVSWQTRNNRKLLKHKLCQNAKNLQCLLKFGPPCLSSSEWAKACYGVSIHLGKTFFFRYLVYETFLWPESWRKSLHIYLLSFPRFWTLSIERFWFFLSILNGVTLKTSNMSALLEIARIYKARKLFADLQRPICYKDPQNSLLIIFTLRPNFGNRWISRIGSLQFWWNSVQHKALRKNVNDSRILTQTPKRRGTITTWHLLQSPNILCYIVDLFLCYPCYMSDLRSK